MTKTVRNHLRARLIKSLLIAIPFLLTSGTAYAEDGLKVQSFKTHGRLVLKIDEGVPVVWKNSSHGFQLTLKGIGLNDLGAPLGQEAEWSAQFKAVEDPRLASLRISESKAGVRVEGQWKFPTGKNAPANPEMEFFEYRDKTPQYLVDFWPKKGPTVAEVEANRALAIRLAALKKAELQAKQRADRRLATEKRRTETEGLTERFCEQPLSEKTDIFLPFLPFHEKVDFSRWLSARTPDDHFTYYVPTAKTEEAQYIRLALSLYQQGKPALAIKALDFFETEYSRSASRHEMRFLKASAMVKLGLNKEAEQLLARLMAEASDSPVALHAGMFVAGHQIEKGSALASLESFLWLINHYPEHRLNWVFHLGAAEALYAMKQTERAAKEYQWVIENAPNERAKAEAAMRIGDLYLDRFQYEQSLAAYYQGFTHFKDEAKRFPSAFVNRGEVLYQLGQFDRAKDALQDFLDNYSAHPAGWRAAFRLGEIHARKPGKGEAEVARKWFYETINRFPMSPGATIARLRLLPCGDQGGFNSESMERFMLEEGQSFDGRGEVTLKRYRDFRGLAHVRALITMGKEDRAVSLALDELHSNGASEARPFLNKIISTLFRKSILKLLAASKKYEALTFYEAKKELISRDMTPEELDYLLKLSQAASDLGLGTLAKQLSESYDHSVKGKLDRGIAAMGESGPDLELLIKQSEQYFTKAKAIWLSPGLASTDAGKSEIRQHLSKVREESRFSFESEIILGLLDESEKKLNSALGHAARAQLLLPKSAGSAAGSSWLEQRRALDNWLASLQFRAGDLNVALGIYRDLERSLELEQKLKAKQNREPGATSQGVSSDNAVIALGLPVVPSLEALVLAQAEILEKLGRWGEAAQTYGRAVEQNWGGNRAIFGYARALIKTGDQTSAKKGFAAMEKVAGSKQDDFWKRLATEALANEKTTAKEGGK